MYPIIQGRQYHFFWIVVANCVLFAMAEINLSIVGVKSGVLLLLVNKMSEQSRRVDY